MSAAAGQFWDAIGRIQSAQEHTIQAAAGAWLALASAADTESGALSSTASQAAGQPGVGLLELAERLEETSNWATEGGAVARQIAEQLQTAGQRTAQANEKALQLAEEFRALEAVSVLPLVGDGMESQMQALADEALAELEALGGTFAGVVGGNAPAAPPGGGPGATTGPSAMPVSGSSSAAASGGGAAAASSAGSASAGAVAASEAAAAESAAADAAAAAEAAEYPNSSVAGAEAGDFEGWVESPSTGYLVDPETGREYDPASGRWIDPVTGEAFGDVTDYAARYSGVGAGPGGIASPGGLTGAPIGGAGGFGGVGAVGGAGLAGGAGVMGAAGLAGMYGGVMPPSVGAAGAARGQMATQAARNMGTKARVATGMAMREAAQGGRPFAPPPGAAHAAGTARTGGSAESGRLGRPTELTEDPEVWAPSQSASSGVLA
ncbi:hypothetical protein [Streptomyces sp. B6B3]|uniref:hypothetical protein n=1 Tax=Streptomyces sp. B6B3 TaxID=3153570 RepID=UPI00325D5C9D